MSQGSLYKFWQQGMQRFIRLPPHVENKKATTN